MEAVSPRASDGGSGGRAVVSVWIWGTRTWEEMAPFIPMWKVRAGAGVRPSLGLLSLNCLGNGAR